MNLFQLILRQMRQRALSTFLTCLSILLGMTLATSTLILAREGRNLFAQTDYGFDLLVGPKASPVQLVFNTIYHVDVSPGNIPYSLYEQMNGTSSAVDGKPNPFRGMVAWAVPYAVGDSYQGRRIVGTTTQLFGVDEAGQPLPADKVPHYRGTQAYNFAQGRAFAPNKFEAVIGNEVARQLGMKVGDTFQATHGVPTADFVPIDVHPEIWKVVGILNETHTANDRVLFIPLMTFYAIFEHEEGLEKIGEIHGETAPGAPATVPASAPAPATAPPEEKAYIMNPDGTIEVKLPKKEWEISAILVQSRSAYTAQQIQFILRNMPDAIGVSPANEMAKFLDTFLPNIRLVLLLISAVVSAVAGVSILVSIYNSVAARNREIAIMRALGATRARILAAICVEAGCIGAMGGIMGLLFGHLMAAAGSIILYRALGSGIGWWRFDPMEMLYLCGIVAVSLLAGLVPGMKAYKVPVAENLVAG